MQRGFHNRQFQWDAGNREKNRLKHGITTGESEEVFSNDPLLIGESLSHTPNELRFRALGRTDVGRELTVIFTFRQDLIRVISARPMSSKERQDYDRSQQTD